MARAIFKSTLKFDNDANPAKSWKSAPGTIPVEFPDWVTKTELYSLAKKDGSVIETGVVASTAAPSQAQLALVPDDTLYAEVERRGQDNYTAFHDAKVSSAFTAPTDEQLALIPTDTIEKEYERRLSESDAVAAGKDTAKPAVTAGKAPVGSIDAAKAAGAPGNAGAAADFAKAEAEAAAAATAVQQGNVPVTDSASTKTTADKAGDGQTSRS